MGDGEQMPSSPPPSSSGAESINDVSETTSRVDGERSLGQAHVLGVYIVAAASILGASLMIAAIAIGGFPDLPAGSGYFIFLATAFIAYLLYQQIAD